MFNFFIITTTFIFIIGSAAEVSNNDTLPLQTISDSSSATLAELAKTITEYFNTENLKEINESLQTIINNYTQDDQDVIRSLGSNPKTAVFPVSPFTHIANQEDPVQSDFSASKIMESAEEGEDQDITFANGTSSENHQVTSPAANSLSNGENVAIPLQINTEEPKETSKIIENRNNEETFSLPSNESSNVLINSTQNNNLDDFVQSDFSLNQIADISEPLSKLPPRPVGKPTEPNIKDTYTQANQSEINPEQTPTSLLNNSSIENDPLDLVIASIFNTQTSLSDRPTNVEEPFVTVTPCCQTQKSSTTEEQVTIVTPVNTGQSEQKFVSPPFSSSGMPLDNNMFGQFPNLNNFNSSLGNNQNQLSSNDLFNNQNSSVSSSSSSVSFSSSSVNEQNLTTITTGSSFMNGRIPSSSGLINTTSSSSSNSTGESVSSQIFVSSNYVNGENPVTIISGSNSINGQIQNQSITVNGEQIASAGGQIETEQRLFATNSSDEDTFEHSTVSSNITNTTSSQSEFSSSENSNESTTVNPISSQIPFSISIVNDENLATTTSKSPGKKKVCKCRLKKKPSSTTTVTQQSTETPVTTTVDSVQNQTEDLPAITSNYEDKGKPAIDGSESLQTTASDNSTVLTTTDDDSNDNQAQSQLVSTTEGQLSTNSVSEKYQSFLSANNDTEEPDTMIPVNDFEVQSQFINITMEESPMSSSSDNKEPIVENSNLPSFVNEQGPDLVMTVSTPTTEETILETTTEHTSFDSNLSTEPTNSVPNSSTFDSVTQVVNESIGSTNDSLSETTNHNVNEDKMKNQSNLDNNNTIVTNTNTHKCSDKSDFAANWYSGNSYQTKIIIIKDPLTGQIIHHKFQILNNPKHIQKPQTVIDHSLESVTTYHPPIKIPHHHFNGHHAHKPHNDFSQINPYNIFPSFRPHDKCGRRTFRASHFGNKGEGDSVGNNEQFSFEPSTTVTSDPLGRITVTSRNPSLGEVTSTTYGAPFLDNFKNGAGSQNFFGRYYFPKFFENVDPAFNLHGNPYYNVHQPYFHGPPGYGF